MTDQHVKKTRHRWRLLTDSDHGLAALLILLVSYFFVVFPLLGGEAVSGGAISIFFSLILVAGIIATSEHNAVKWGIVAVAVVTFLTHWLHVFFQGNTAHIVATSSTTAFFAMQTWFLSKRVFSGGTVNIYRILGAVALYLVLGALWADAFLLVYLTNPDAFAFSPNSQAFEPPVSEMFYFSFATLTTVGYGDITPLTPMARSLAMLEALVGQLYPAIILAHLVSQYVARRPSR